MLFPKKFGNFCDSHDFVNFASLALIIQGNQGGLMLQAPEDCEKYNRMKDLSHAVPTSTSQGSLTEILHTGGFKESVPDINALPKDLSGQQHRTEQKKGKYKSL